MPPPQQKIPLLSISWLNTWLFSLLIVGLLPLTAVSDHNCRPSDDCNWLKGCSERVNVMNVSGLFTNHPGDSMYSDVEVGYLQMENILKRIDCSQEYSIHVKNGQCDKCRKAYGDWLCAIGVLDVYPETYPICDSVCERVMRVCPYLSPDRVQLSAEGDWAFHPSQVGGHPAFYCPPSVPTNRSCCWAFANSSESDEELDHDKRVFMNCSTHEPDPYSYDSAPEELTDEEEEDEGFLDFEPPSTSVAARSRPHLLPNLRGVLARLLRHTFSKLEVYDPQP